MKKSDPTTTEALQSRDLDTDAIAEHDMLVVGLIHQLVPVSPVKETTRALRRARSRRE